MKISLSCLFIFLISVSFSERDLRVHPGGRDTDNLIQRPYFDSHHCPLSSCPFHNVSCQVSKCWEKKEKYEQIAKTQTSH